MDQARMSALLSLDAEDRYWHTVDRAAETGRFWALRGDAGWLTPVAPEGFEYLALWPDRALAQLVADLRHPGNAPVEITLEEFRADWIDDLEGEGLRVGIFPDSDGAFWDVDAIALFDAVDDAMQSRI